MTDGTEAPAAGSRQREDVLLPPRSREAADVAPSLGGPEVRREQLLRRLDALGDEVCLVVLEAPLGYGKTTTLRQWAESTAAAVRWVQVTAHHSDPGRLATALMTAVNGIGVPPAVGGTSRRRGPTARQLAARIDEIARTRPLTVVFEDLHRARGGAAAGLVAELASLMPAGSRIVVTTDRPLRWRVGRLVAEGRCVELGADDLAFDTSETGTLLAAAGLHLPPAAVSELVRRTGGWPYGLCLALPILTASSEPAAVAQTLDGENHAFTEFFHRHVLAGLPDETLRFLMRTAVLEQISGPLCDAALATSGSAGRLGETRALGLFLAPADGTGEWYRLHPLFAMMLRGELRRLEPGADLRIHRNASLWYEGEGRRELAIEHALAGRADVTAGRMIVAHTQWLNSQGRIAEVRRWLERLDEDTIASYPPLGPMAAWAWALTGDARRARRALGLGEAGWYDGPLPDGSASLESAVLRIRAALAPRGVEAMLVDAERAVALEPTGSRWQSMASLLLGVAQWLNGAHEEAARSLESAHRFATASQGPGAVAALGQRAWLAAQHEDWAMAEACAGEATEQIRAGGLLGYMPTLTTNLANARVALKRGEPDRAVTWTRRALDLYASPSPRAFPWLAVQSAVTLGHLQLELDDHRAARLRLSEARAAVRRLRPSGVLGSMVADLARAVAHAGLEDGTTLTAAELRVLRLLPSHLSLAQIGDELVVTRNTVKGHVDAIYRKLGVSGRAEAVRRARETGLLD